MGALLALILAVAASLGAGVPEPVIAGAEVVDHPRSVLVEFSRQPGGVVASVWRWCPPGRCSIARYAVAVSDDGFQTRVVPDLPGRHYPQVYPAGPDRAVVTQGRIATVVAVDGSVMPLERPATTRPAARGEVVVQVGQVWAVDADTGAVHQVPVPDDLEQVWRVGGELRGVTYPDRGRGDYVWSGDGGAIWEHARLPVAHALWSPVAEAPRPTLIEGADGATLLPFLALHVFDEASDTWRSVPGPDDPTGYSATVAVRPDGRLLVSVPIWGDARPGQLVTEPGLWVSTDEGWTGFERVEPGPPFARGVFQPTVLQQRRTERFLEITVTNDHRRVWTSRDSGQTWREIAVR